METQQKAAGGMARHDREERAIVRSEWQDTFVMDHEFRWVPRVSAAQGLEDYVQEEQQ